MGRKQGKGRPQESPHLSVVKAVVHVPPIKSFQCPSVDSLQQIQTGSALSEVTALWGCTQPSKVSPQKLVIITELAVSHRSGPRPSTCNYCCDFEQMGRDYVSNVCG